MGARSRALAQTSPICGCAALPASKPPPCRQEFWPSNLGRAAVQAWRHLGGSARHVVLDNQKEAVLEPVMYEPALNQVHAATLAYFVMVTDPTRVRIQSSEYGRTRYLSHPVNCPQGSALRDHRGAERLPGALGRRVDSLSRSRCRAPSVAGKVRRGARAPAAAAHHRQVAFHRSPAQGLR